MQFSDINWIAILTATAANVLLAYLFFDSPLATKWKAALAEEPQAGKSTFARYIDYILHSLMLAVVIWLVTSLAHVTGSSVAFINGIVFLIFGLASGFLTIFVGPDFKSKKYRIFLWFIFTSLSVAYWTVIPFTYLD